MGGGNAAKSAAKRMKAVQQAAKSAAGSQLKQNEAAKSVACKICLQTFVVTSAEKVLRDHWENRHPKSDFYDAFPHLKA